MWIWHWQVESDPQVIRRYKVLKKIYSCLEDYDMAIDDFIIEHETFPIIEKDEEHICDYCKEKSAYHLTKIEAVADHSGSVV